jgi:ketosteroid isomerase-like protein
MGYSRAEIEETFARYQDVAAKAAVSGDWGDWAEMFTEDATYIEHHFGNFNGRAAIREWIEKTMATPPNNEMTSFPIEWYVIDEEKGWVVCCVQNRMADIGDGTVHQAANWTLLKYAGSGKWSYEEDLYNPTEFGEMIRDWAKAKKA